MVGVAALGNRLMPLRSGIDSAWRGTEGNARELTSFLRGEGFTCSDEGSATNVHVHRLCAKFDGTSKVAIEFAGPTDGEIMRVHVQSHGPLTPEGTEAATRAIELSVPEQTAQQDARRVLSAGPNSAENISGPWGTADWSGATFTVARTWTGPSVGTHLPGGLDEVRARAAQAGYRCDDAPDVLRCQRVANGAAWTFTAHPSADRDVLSRVLLMGAVNDPERLDPADELGVVLPPSRELDRMQWFVATADQASGGAGFAGGVRIVYAVTPTQVSVDAGTACRVDEGVISC